MDAAAVENRERIRALVESFRARAIELRGEGTSEAQIRLEFLDPFWEALGWDVRNRGGKSEAEKDVVVEGHIGTIEAGRMRARRSDYLFRIDGFPRFFVEAKKPAVDLSADKDAIFQAKTYAWNAKIPFAIVTDFEEFRLFDATPKPYYNEPERGRVAEFDLRFEDYVAQWDVLCETFSRESVAGGSLERLLAKIKKVRAGRRIRGFDRMLFELRGTDPVDRVFLAHLEEYRLRFARDLYAHNRQAFPDAETRHGAARLTEAVGRIIDRIVFMRICEDREIVPYGGLRDVVQHAIDHRLDLYSLIVEQFREFDARYNGFLFKAHFSEQLAVSDQLLADFLRTLYQPEEPYRFDVIGDDLLGIVYERFLGSVVTVQRGQVDQTEKPEVRHAGGVYYTPRFVVDTIIRRVVGPKIEAKSPIECLDVKILDPACGSGSFLLAAFDYLIQHCAQYITAKPKAAEVPAARGRRNGKSRNGKRRIAFKDSRDRWQLTPAFKADLLTSCLHGIDIDAQAVEVTIMSLYIKTLEGEIPREMLDLRALPDLANNIRCGNSLISPDDFDRYWEEEHGMLFGGDEDAQFRINAFDWHSRTRGFGRLLEEREGFDCIIGNPPYIRVQELKKWAPEECEFYKWRYKSAARGNYDIYVPFIERGLELLAPDGHLGIICPHKFWQAAYGRGIREIIARGRHLRSIIDFGDQQVFRGATTYTAIHILSRQPKSGLIDYTQFQELTDGDAQCEAIVNGKKTSGVTRYRAAPPEDDTPWAFNTTRTASWCDRVREKGTRLGEIAEVFVGVQTSADNVFHLDIIGRTRTDVRVRCRRVGSEERLEVGILRPLVSGADVSAFAVRSGRQVILFPYDWQSSGRGSRLLGASELKRDFPRAWDYLRRHESLLRSRENGSFDDSTWYRFGRSQNIGRQRGPKLCVPRLATKLCCGFDASGSICLDNVDVNGIRVRADFAAEVDHVYLCAIVNSKLADLFVKSSSRYRFRGGFASFNRQFIENIPVVLPETAAEKRLATAITERSHRLLQAKTRLQTSSLATRDRDRLERQVEADEAKLDELVFALYDVAELAT